MRHRVLAQAVGIAVALAAVVAPAEAQLLPTIGAQQRIDLLGGTFAANETTVSVSEANPREIIVGWNDWRRSTNQEIINAGFALSLDAGATWSDFLIRPPAGRQTNVEGDPMTAFDQRTGAIWAGAIAFGGGGMYVARKDPGDANFQPSTMADLGGGIDKCWMAAGPQFGRPDTTRVYIAYNLGIIWSDDMGDTFTNPRTLGSGIGFLPRVGPDGEIYVAYWDFGTGVLLKRSLNNGSSFTTHRMATRMDVWGTQDGSRFPGNMRVPSMNYLAVDPNDGTLYCVYFDTTNIVNGQRNVDLYFTSSTDQGSTWSAPVVINDDNDPPGDQFWPWIEVDPDGRLHVSFFDSRLTVQNDNITNGMFDVFYMYSVNGGATWHEFRLTPNSWNCNNDGLNRGQQFIGDYNGLGVANNVAYPGYLDTSNGDPDIYTNVIGIPVWGDTNGDGLVNFADLLKVLREWGACPRRCDADINGSGSVDFADILLVIGNWS